jgi:uncharacterized Zn ribbon protein
MPQVQGERPACPNCGSTNLWSKGVQYKCTQCGKWFAKYPRQVKPDFSLRPQCPDCGERHAYSKSHQWQCAVCGACWQKKPHVQSSANPTWGFSHCKEED